MIIVVKIIVVMITTDLGKYCWRLMVDQLDRKAIVNQKRVAQ